MTFKLCVKNLIALIFFLFSNALAFSQSSKQTCIAGALKVYLDCPNCDEDFMRINLGLLERFPDVAWIPGFWIEYGMAAICIGGGLGGAILVERV